MRRKGERKNNKMWGDGEIKWGRDEEGEGDFYNIDSWQIEKFCIKIMTVEIKPKVEKKVNA